MANLHAQLRTQTQEPARAAAPLNRELLARLTVRPVVVTSATPAQVPPDAVFAKDVDGSLLTGRLRIREMHARDEQAFVALARQVRAEVERHMPIYANGEDESAMFARQLNAAIEGDRHGHAWRRLVTLRDSGEIIGCVNLNSIQRGMSFEADVALWIAPSFQGRGLGREALQAAVRFATADMPEGLGLHRIHGGVSPTNTASASMALRLGFRREEGKQSLLRIGERWERHDFYVFDPLT